MGGRWEQLSMGAATHLPIRAGHNRMLTAKAGAWGAKAPHVFSFFFEIVHNST